MKSEVARMRQPQVIAFYLPQFHPTPENDAWWGKGFTEWTNVTKARKLFPGHDQPKLPSDLGFYDLRVAETRVEQAQMAQIHGITGFCYWHYWFGRGKRLLNRPFEEVLTSNQPDFPFCLAWANESWRGFPHGLKNRNTLIAQEYLGTEDYERHFFDVLPAFRDRRYIRVAGRPLFLVYRPLAAPEVRDFLSTWRRLAAENGLPGIHFVGHVNDPAIDVDSVLEIGFDSVNTVRLNDYFQHESLVQKAVRKFRKSVLSHPNVIDYGRASHYFIDDKTDSRADVFPSLIPNWDHTPRSGRDGLVLQDSTPDRFRKHLAHALNVVSKKREESRILFLKSWNEWAEGNMVEPDRRWGSEYLKVLREGLDPNAHD